MIGTSTWIPDAPLVFTQERRSSFVERLSDQVCDLDRVREAFVGRIEVEDDVVRSLGLSTREYHAFMSTQFISTIQRRRRAS